MKLPSIFSGTPASTCMGTVSVAVGVVVSLAAMVMSSGFAGSNIDPIELPAVSLPGLADMRVGPSHHHGSALQPHEMSTALQPLIDAVENHAVFGSVNTLPDLQRFMEHHVFCVWDFMSLVKSLQAVLAPTAVPWSPRPNTELVRMINEIILAEESDEVPPSLQAAAGNNTTSHASYASHFELYITAMKEVGANTAPVEDFIRTLLISDKGLEAALSLPNIPVAARDFMKDTTSTIGTGQAHRIASSFAFGRENVIPGMFSSLLSKLGISQSAAPTFHYYLERHIHLDGDEHGPMALHLLDTLCNNEPTLLKEAFASAKDALVSRRQLWDQLHLVLSSSMDSAAAAVAL